MDNEVVLFMPYRGSSKNRSPVVFDGPPWKMRIYCCTFGYSYDELIRLEYNSNMKIKYFIFLYDKWDSPSVIDGFKLVEECLTKTHGYSYAIYERAF
jgi:hypothetical protein